MFRFVSAVLLLGDATLSSIGCSASDRDRPWAGHGAGTDGALLACFCRRS